MKLTTKTMLVVLSFLTLTAVSIISISAYYSYSDLESFEKTYADVAYAKAKEETKNQVDMALSIAYAIYERKQLQGASEEETQKAVKDILREISFSDGAGYMFVYDYSGTRLVLKAAAATEGQNFYELKDKRGTQLVKELIDASKSGGGYVTYYFPKAKGVLLFQSLVTEQSLNLTNGWLELASI